MSLRPGAVNFEDKWCDLQSTISAVVQLHPVPNTTWNDHYSYPMISPATPPPPPPLKCLFSIDWCGSDIYALCEAFPKSYAETLYTQTQQLLTEFVTKLQEVSAVFSECFFTVFL